MLENYREVVQQIQYVENCWEKTRLREQSSEKAKMSNIG